MNNRVGYMRKFVATRELLYSQKGSHVRKRLLVKVGAPRAIEVGTVNFEFDPGASVCEIEIDGLPESFSELVYGADSIQAISMAADIDPYLKRIEKKYDLYWLSGEPYFEE
jgi:hypothetical protein